MFVLQDYTYFLKIHLKLCNLISVVPWKWNHKSNFIKVKSPKEFHLLYFAWFLSAIQIICIAISTKSLPENSAPYKLMYHIICAQSQTAFTVCSLILYKMRNEVCYFINALMY